MATDGSSQTSHTLHQPESLAEGYASVSGISDEAAGTQPRKKLFPDHGDAN